MSGCVQQGGRQETVGANEMESGSWDRPRATASDEVSVFQDNPGCH